MASTRASGTNAVRYGTMRENVLSLTAVMPNGEVVRTARRARKSAAGYDLTRLLVGAEGTLGVITEVSLKLYGIPEAISAGVCPFASVRSACEAVIMTIQLGIPVARIELVDAEQIRMSNAYSGLKLAETTTLFLEFHGTERGVAEQAEMFAEIAREHGGGPFEWATKTEDRNRLWQARHDAFWAAKTAIPGKESLASDVCVPISRLADCVEETCRDLEEHGLRGPIVGHVGDGNFHVVLFCDMADRAEIDACEAFLDRLVMRALAMEGTCTGEHGVGDGKRKFLVAEHGAGVQVMRTIKQALDPLNIMNPGKILPA
jgi:D-lactate dehydrogenase (cytochrome)